MTDFDFNYGLGSDGREWTATFHTMAFEGEYIESTISLMSGVDIYRPKAK